MKARQTPANAVNATPILSSVAQPCCAVIPAPATPPPPVLLLPTLSISFSDNTVAPLLLPAPPLPPPLPDEPLSLLLSYSVFCAPKPIMIAPLIKKHTATNKKVNTQLRHPSAPFSRLILAEYSLLDR